jgi:hypothetical protein
MTPILGHVHMLLVQHATCPEHGEMVHADAGGISLPRASSHDAANRPPTAASSPDLESESHEHDHCLLASARKVEVALRFVGPALSASGPSTPQLHHWRTIVQPPIALHVLAPKNSPPV